MSREPDARFAIDGFVFDMDGTVSLGGTALPGAAACIAALRARGKKLIFVSNNPLEPPEAYASKLTQLGITTEPNQVVTSARVIAHHLAATCRRLRYYVVGEGYLVSELRSHGLTVVDELDGDSTQVIEPNGIDAVIVAFDRTLDYRKLNTAYQALSRGARFFATNADKTCPMPDGAIPDAGATIAALEHITGRKVELIGGKPSRVMVQAVLDELGLPPNRCMMVGDRLETDIRMGQDAGMRTAVALTGVSTRADALSMRKPPDLVLNNLSELIAHIL